MDSSASTMHACFVFGMLLYSQLFASVSRKPKAGALCFSSFARHCRFHWNFQLSPCVSDGLFIFPIFRIDEINVSPPSSIVTLWPSRLPILAFLSSERLLPFWTKLQATNYQVWLLLEFLLISPGPQISLWRFLFQHSELFESFPRI